MVQNDKIKQVATISANNDESIGSLIAEAMKVVGKDGMRKKVLVDVKADNGFSFNGYSKDERNDANDHLTLNLPIGSSCMINVNDISRSIVLEKEELIEFNL